MGWFIYEIFLNMRASAVDGCRSRQSFSRLVCTVSSLQRKKSKT